MPGLISPPVTAKTPIATLSGWNLVLRCPNCGDRHKAVDSLFSKVHRSRLIGEVIPRLTCDVCRAKPVGMKGVCAWMASFARDLPSEDLSFLLLSGDEKAA